MRLVESVLAVALVTAPATACREGHSDNVKETANMKELVIPVDGMACGSCAARVKKTLVAIDGVGETTVSVDEKNVVTHYDPRKLSPERLVAAIKGLGFKAGAPVEAAR